MVLQYSPGFYPFSSTRPDFYFYCTRPDSTLSQYSPGPFFSTRLDSTFSVFAWISTFPVLIRILPFRYSPRFHLSNTRSDFYFSGTLTDSTFFGTRRDPTFPVLTQTLFRQSPRFYHSSVLARISLSFPASCPDSSSSPASRSNFIIFFDIMPGSLIFLGIVLGFL